jgi:hypothetical protein
VEEFGEHGGRVLTAAARHPEHVLLATAIGGPGHNE